MMKIASSQVAMASNHRLETQVSIQKASLTVKAEDGETAKKAVAAVYERSGGSMAAAMEEYKRESSRRTPSPAVDERRAKERWLEEQRAALQSYATDFQIDDEDSLRISLLEKLLEAIRGKGKVEPVRIGGFETPALDLRGDAARSSGTRARMFGVSAFAFLESVSVSVSAEGAEAGTSSAGTLWKRVNAVSAERSEQEYTAFRSKGRALTEDGRRIDFNVEFAMSRAFSERFDALSAETYVLTDPLIVNLGGGATSVGDVKFRFDLDSDGTEEEISFAGEGSGFLALDRDGNGKIDDGSELFGTRSGDGFADLAAYDEDGNGWIDENDGVYAKLRVWVRDADGGDRLLDLKEADVGAIYLGSADTEFSFKDAATNELNGVMRRTGVYLRESGGAGTLSHIDLRC